MAKWITIEEIERTSPAAKTRRWTVRAKQGGDRLGLIHWDTGWHCYVFAPAPYSEYEQDCLRDIATFIEEQTAAHKAAAS